MLEALARDLRGPSHADLTRAARRAQALALLALAAPGLPLGGLYTLTRPAPLTPPWVGAVTLLAALLALVALRLAHLAARDPVGPARGVVLNASMRAATAPGVPFLLGCVFLRQPAALLALWGMAALALLAAWSLVPGWVRSAQGRTEGLGQPSGEGRQAAPPLS
ncbi:hypothetical protein [Deinococcus hopiensis]|uniref:Uncharacterized protein n=1 Tax=Deinococcus hopiensis KR-140 TaxID=695939 RepID=A0A1W1VQN0_9DEIO|nr:hypothetical protein [Deinococcus hopiensis]SMB95646.1 hypothetical protein SAMN00790413_02926 [Deinococcus hopiensis KR-140]